MTKEEPVAYIIQVRIPGGKRFNRYFGTGGALPMRRVHACQYLTRGLAEMAVRGLKEDNPEYEFRVKLW